MKQLLLVFKGFMVGIANLIPGVSGGTMAIIVGIYEKLINTISHLFQKLKEEFFFLLFLGIGFILSLVLGSKGIKYCLNNFRVATVLAFLGLVIGGIPMLYKAIKNKKNISNIISCIITFTIVLIVTFLNPTTNHSLSNITFTNAIILIILGFISAGTMIIPGISGSLVLMILGYYDFLLGIISNITNFDKLGYNISILGFFSLGCVIGIFSFAILINFLIKKFEDQSNSAILGFILASLISMVYQNFKGTSINQGLTLVLEIIIGILLFAGCMIITYRLSFIEKPKKAIPLDSVDEI